MVAEPLAMTDLAREPKSTEERLLRFNLALQKSRFAVYSISYPLVLLNLVSNAIKFAPSDTLVTLRVCRVIGSVIAQRELAVARPPGGHHPRAARAPDHGHPRAALSTVRIRHASAFEPGLQTVVFAYGNTTIAVRSIVSSFCAIEMHCHLRPGEGCAVLRLHFRGENLDNTTWK